MSHIRMSIGFGFAIAACTAACSGAPGGQDLSGQQAPSTPAATAPAIPDAPATRIHPSYPSVLPMPGAEHTATAEPPATAKGAEGAEGAEGAPSAGHTPTGGEDGPGGGPGTQGAHFNYKGGPVISKVKVYAVFWSSSVASQSDLATFYSTISGSEYVGQLSEYNTPTQRIHPGAFVSSYVDDGAPSSSQVDDSDVQQELARLIEAGSLPQPDGNTLFMVHFPPNLSITMQGASSCQQFCAYHSSFAFEGGSVYYAIMPDFGGACVSCSGESKQFDRTTVVTSHELAEAITDPNIGVANQTQDERQLAWFDDTYDEIADVCENHTTTFDGYRVTDLWSNRANACVPPPAKGGH